MSQFNAQFNLKSNVAQQLGQINAGLGGLNKQVQALGGSASGASKPMESLGKSIQKMGQANLKGVAADMKALANGVRMLDRSTGKIQGLATTIGDLSKAFSKSGAAGVKAYADAVGKLATQLKIAAAAAKELTKYGVKLGKVPAGAAVPKAVTATAKPGGVPPGFTKGAFQPLRKDETAKNLAQIGSAAQGAAIGMSILQRNMQGVMFGIIFMQFGLVKTIALFAALTVAIGIAVGAFAGWISIVTKAASVGVEFERRGQQMASWLRSGEMAGDVYRLGEELSRTFGIGKDEATELAFTLAKTGQMSDVYAKGILNVAAANGESVADVGHRWNAIMMADSEARAGLIERFAKDYGLPIKEYTDALELATTMNERFAGSAEAAAGTTAGMWGRVKANMGAFMVSMGKIVNEMLKPFLDLMIAFTDGLVDGFNAAFEAAGGADEAKMTLDAFRESMRKLIPWVQHLGALIGKWLFWSLQRLAQVLKFVSGALNAALKFWKEYRDEVKITGKAFITNFIDAISSPEVILAAATTFVTTFISSLVTGFAKVAWSATGEGILSGIGNSIKVIPKAFFEGFVEGAKKGLITALFEAFALTVVDMLPISEGLKTSISGVIRAAFLGGAIGSVIPGVGTALGALIAGGIALGFEQAFPGSVTRMFNTMDTLLVKGFKGAKGIIGDFYNFLTTDGTKAWDEDEQNVMDDNTAYNHWAEDIENKHTPRIVQAWDWLRDNVLIAVGAVTDFFKGPFMDALKEIWSYIDGPTKRVWQQLVDMWNGDVGKAAFELKEMFQAIWDVLVLVWQKVIDNKVTWEALELYLKFQFMSIMGTLWLAIEAIHLALELLGLLIGNILVPAFRTIKDVFQLVADLMRGDWSSAVGNLKDIGLDLLTLFLWPLITALDVIKMITGVDIASGIVTGFGLIKDAIIGAANVLVGVGSTIGTSFLEGVEIAINGAITIINGLIKGYNNTIGRIAGKIDELPSQNFANNNSGGEGGGGSWGGGSSGGGNANLGGRGDQGEWIPRQHGGIVPGPHGSKRLILAEAGEYFGGDPDMARAAGRFDGGGGTTINLDLRGAIISDDEAMDRFVLKIGNSIAGTWFSTRRMTLPRSG